MVQVYFLILAAYNLLTHVASELCKVDFAPYQVELLSINIMLIYDSEQKVIIVIYDMISFSYISSAHVL